MSTETMTRQDAAAIIADQFTTSTRADGSSYVTCQDDSDAKQLVRDVHFQVFDGMFPNDWVYEKTRAIVETWSETEEEDVEGAIADGCVDMMSADLYRWIAYNLVFAGFVNEAMEQEHFASLDDAIMRGQYEALYEMTNTIAAWLEAYADTRS